MDFLHESKKLLQAAQNAAQETAQKAGEAIDAATEITTDFVTSGTQTIEQWTQDSSAVINQTAQQASNTAASLGATGAHLATALAALPQTVEELAREMPKIAQRLKSAGVRSTDLPRSDAEIMKLFDKIPATSKFGRDPQTTIRQFLSDKHGSHIIPHSQGGSNAANNIVWEVGIDNIRRSAQAMTSGEQVYIRIYNAVDSIVRNAGAIAPMGITVTFTATLTQVIVTAIAYSLDLYRGDMTIEEYQQLILETAKSVGLSTPIFFLVFIAVLALFPEFAVLLSAPAVVAGFNALLGLSVATPIIQSLTRHTEAGGFGEEASSQYNQLKSSLQGQIDDWVQSSSH
ncbi:HNH endonuclease [Myxacorys almedinensis]|uniref:HNH endonuclease n=1 Tax=Myxacorys almedinensis A TaxID=2690445 RepID=A0A8J8CIB1_9CYAN|nr:HNH endonuclease [Myxacorys almedinensis]NDJ17554.1 HNH endonuclease [Myxacorys almedinensis A]